MAKPTRRLALRPKYWVGEPPLTCDACGEQITDEFSDATIGGSWGCWCPRCVEKYGVTYGTGAGQRYTKQSDDKWLKTAG